MNSLTPETQTGDNGGGVIPPRETTDEWGGFPDRELYAFRLPKGAGYGVLRLSGLQYDNYLISADTASAVRGPDDAELEPLLEEIETDELVTILSSDRSRLFN